MIDHILDFGLGLATGVYIAKWFLKRRNVHSFERKSASGSIKHTKETPNE